ncbi:PspA/IM30 family protein [Alloacidobacterium dinghuense]|uniref:PspA/IM30 family protein n=1 Tax=Alloacidobacterium dinghuense TaxID=2763107 RepID=A0A7G8BIE8_9BACT|nr:PspA/IM30 family protein [Alloacidobacterium dinghuense]QNI32318.1 PspA/IM30 family protein [Alloacidobacterium dinghuense]
MALLERVSALLRANVNDLIDKAEDPEKMLKQLVLDMENQLLQVKTQVAIAIADQHLLEKKKKEHDESAEEWHKKAELAVSKSKDDLARAALERALSHEQMAHGFAQQIEDQSTEADSLRTALRKLEQKLTETRSRCEMLIAQHRRARVVNRANQVRQKIVEGQNGRGNATGIDRMRLRVAGAESENAANNELLGGDTLEDRLAALEREEQIEGLLRELKERQGKTA